MSVTYVCGHKSPDTDSVLSAIVYSYYLQYIYPEKNIEPITAGPISHQTSFILQKFKQAPPEVRIDITPTLAQIPVNPNLTVLNGNDPLSRAFDLYHKKRHSTFPVVDNDTFLGILQIAQLVSVFTRPEKESELRAVNASINSICKAVKGKRISCIEDDSIIKDYYISVVTQNLEGLKKLTKNWCEADWRSYIFPLSGNKEIIEYLIEKKAGIIVLSKQSDASHGNLYFRLAEREDEFNRNDSCLDIAEMQRKAQEMMDSSANDYSIMATDSFVYEESEVDDNDPNFEIYYLFNKGNSHNDTILITTELTVASSILLLKYSTPIKFFLKRDKLSHIDGNLPIDVLKTRFIYNQKLHSVAVVDSKKKFLNFLTAYDLNNISAVHLVLVDHNEVAYYVNGSHASGVKITEIVDHHKITIKERNYTMKMTIRPLGCTCTIITQMFLSKGLEPTPLQAGLLLSAIMTDTLILTSPTTTDIDRRIVPILERISGLDYKQWGQEIFGAVEGFSGADKEKTIRGDYKKFDSKLGYYGVSQVEVGSLETLTETILTEIKAALASIKYADKCFMTCCLVTDVTKGVSAFFVDAPQYFNEVIGVEHWKGMDWAYNMPGVVSRKKYLMPKLIQVVQMLE